jgi:GR25 family glycosyltransferase involved in LPS biosynthesis
MSFYRRRDKRRVDYKIAQLRKKVEKNEAFNKIPKYYINLDRSVDRREALEAEIALYEVENIHRFKAIDGRGIKDIHQGEIDGVQYVNDYSNCTKYQLAITLSHLECIRRVGEKGEFPFIILEDDVRFTLMPHWKKNIDEIIAELPEDCDILNLVHHNDKNNILGFTSEFYTSAVAYLVTEKGYNQILNIFYKDIWLFSKKLKLINCYIDFGIRSILKTYHYNPVLFLLDGDHQKYSTHTGSSNYYKYIKIYLKKYI